MKSRVESLFDTDLVSKDTGIEKLYGLVERADVYSDRFIEWLDKPKIKRDYLKLTKKYPEKDWNGPKGTWWTSMKKIQSMDEAEVLRELLYVIVCSIDTSRILSKNSGTVSFLLLQSEIYEVMKDYVDGDITWRLQKAVKISPAKTRAAD